VWLLCHPGTLRFPFLPWKSGKCNSSCHPRTVSYYRYHWKQERATHPTNGNQGIQKWDSAKQILVGQNGNIQILIGQSVNTQILIGQRVRRIYRIQDSGNRTSDIVNIGSHLTKMRIGMP
jgi:hypothetical protein